MSQVPHTLFNGPSKQKGYFGESSFQQGDARMDCFPNQLSAHYAAVGHGALRAVIFMYAGTQ